MKSVKYSILFLLCCVGGIANAQTESDTLLAKDNVMIPLPTISLNVGFNHLMSDVLLSNEGPSPFRQLGYQLSITQRVAKFLNVTLDLYTGAVYGEEQRNQTNLNFRTSLFSQHLNLEYNFYPLLKPDSRGRQLFRPYVGVGVGTIFFRSKGDLKDASGAEYQYWTDGQIYAQAEGSVNQSEATPLTRDFEYETDLRDANLDGLRKYPQTAFSLPINAGIRFQITKNIGVNAAFAYALNFSDMIDNVSESGSGDRLGAPGNDNHLFGSIGLSIFLGRTKPSSKPKKIELELIADNDVASDSSIEETEDDVNVNVKSSKEADLDLNDTQTLAELKERPTTEIIEATESPTLASARILEQASVQANNLSDAINKSEESSIDLANAVNVIQEKSGKASNSSKKEVSEIIKKQTDLLDQLKESTLEYHSWTNDITQSSKNSEFNDVIDKSITKLNSSNQKVNESKKSDDLAKIANNVKEINAEIISAVQNQREIQKSRINQAKLDAFNDKLSLFEFASESDDLTKEDQTKLDRLKANLTEEYTKLLTTGVIKVEDKQAYSEILSSQTEETVAISNTSSSSANSVAFDSADKEQSAEKDSQSEVKNNTESANQESLIKQSPTTAEIENTPPKKSGGFHWADLNENGWISPDEVLHFIDLLFEGEAVRTVEDIQNLIDYYFDQE